MDTSAHLVRRLYDRIRPQWEEYRERHPSLAVELRDTLKSLPPQLRTAFYEAALAIEQLEECYCDLGTPQATPEYLAMLEKKQRHLDDPHDCNRRFYRDMRAIMDALKPPISSGPSLFETPLWATFDHLDAQLSLLSVLVTDTRPDGHFKKLFKLLPTDRTLAKLTPKELIEVYFGGTPIETLLNAPVPVPLPTELRFAHTWIVAPSGGGKTTLLQNLVLNDLQSPERPGLIILDPHSDISEKVKRADLGISDRLVIIDPRDPNPPTINIFAMNRGRMSGYDDMTKERIANNVIQTFDFFFGSFGVEMTGRQRVFFQFLIRFLLSFPDVLGRNATIEDLFNITLDPLAKNPTLPEPYLSAVEHLGELERTFFKREFYSPSFRLTHEAIRARLYAILQQPALKRMLAAEETTIDLVAELAKGSIIILDTAQDYLGENSKTFASLMTTFVLQAVHERMVMEERRPVFFYIDEAGQVLGSGGGIEALLTDARKARLGLIIANHNLEQTTTAALRAALKGTAIKFIGPEDTAARDLSGSMRTNADFIRSLPLFHFAMHVRGMNRPYVIKPKPDPFNHVPKLSERAVEEMMRRNQARFAVTPRNTPPITPPVTSYPITPTSPSPQQDDEDLTPRW